MSNDGSCVGCGNGARDCSLRFLYWFLRYSSAVPFQAAREQSFIHPCTTSAQHLWIVTRTSGFGVCGVWATVNGIEKRVEAFMLSHSLCCWEEIMMPLMCFQIPSSIRSRNIKCKHQNSTRRSSISIFLLASWEERLRRTLTRRCNLYKDGALGDSRSPTPTQPPRYSTFPHHSDVHTCLTL